MKGMNKHERTNHYNQVKNDGAMRDQLKDWQSNLSNDDSVELTAMAVRSR